MRILGTPLAVALGLFLAQAATAGEECCGAPDHCGRCGCQRPCEKYCKVVPDVKEIKKTVWNVRCEDFCPSLPACGCHDGCGCGQSQCEGKCQDGCESCGHCGKGRDVCPSTCPPPPPKCGCVRTKKVLESKEVICKVPTWKCVVVYCCPDCGEGCAAQGFAPDPAPPLPPGPAVPKRAKTAGHLPEFN